MIYDIMDILCNSECVFHPTQWHEINAISNLSDTIGYSFGIIRILLIVR